MKRWLACAALVLGIGCAGAPPPIPPPPDGAVDVSPETALSFQARAESFYVRLIQRRFNALETFNDRFLRSHFRTENAFFDYYAELANGFSEARIEGSRPTRAVILDFVFGSEDSVLVQVSYIGEDNRPLRPNEAALVRIDRWDRHENDWWITPGAIWR